MAASKNQNNSLISKSPNKETIYVEADDEIIHIIDKVKESDSKIVALVLPKRSTTLLSLVNMKLLKRSADSAKKHIVLITSEASLMPLAGAAGVYVAKTLQNRPEIPKSPKVVSESEIEDLDKEDLIDKSLTIGSLSAATKASMIDDDVIEFDNISTEDIDNPKSNVGKANKKKVKKDKKLKVPNFERFRLGIVLAVLGAVVLIGGWILAFVVLPKAVVTIKTDTSSAVASFDFTAGTKISEVDTNKMKMPAEIKEIKKTESEKGTASGERDEGTRASGKVTISEPCSTGFLSSIPAGTAVSTGGLDYITQDKAVLSQPSGSGSNCVFSDTVKVIAASNGDKYNIDKNKTFTVAGSSAKAKNSSSIDGGTTKIVKFVTQKDIDEAVNRINERLGSSVKTDLSSSLSDEKLLPLDESFTSSDPKIKSNPEINNEASEFSVTYETTYSMLGVKKDDLLSLIKEDIKEDVDLKKQSIVDDGIANAVMKVNHSSGDEASIGFRTSIVAGPEIDEKQIKDDIKGKKYGEVESYIKSIKDVKDVSVDYSPFWVYSTPKSTKKIKIIVEKADIKNNKDGSDSEKR